MGSSRHFIMSSSPTSYMLTTSKCTQAGRRNWLKQLGRWKTLLEHLGWCWASPSVQWCTTPMAGSNKVEEWWLGQTDVQSEIEDDRMYQYLGVEQRFSADHRATKIRVEEYIGRVREVWRSKLGNENKVSTHNVWGVAILWYYLGTVQWCRGDMQRLD